MSLAMQHFRECLEENHIRYHESWPDSNIITDIGIEENVFNPCWDVCGYEGYDTVHLYLHSYIPPELAVEIIKIYENYFAEKEN